MTGTPTPRDRALLWLAALLSLTGCGGGLYVGFGGGGDDPPSVSVAVSPDSAARGATVRLVAAASDDFGVARVEFFRVDGAGSVSLGSDASAPYQLDTIVPAAAGSRVDYYARATDDAGQSRDSALATLTVLP